MIHQSALRKALEKLNIWLTTPCQIPAGRQYYGMQQYQSAGLQLMSTGKDGMYLLHTHMLLLVRTSKHHNNSTPSIVNKVQRFKGPQNN